jgi:hypothetical protein
MTRDLVIRGLSLHHYDFVFGPVHRERILTGIIAALEASRFKWSKNGGGEGNQPSLAPLLRFAIQGVAFAA